MLNVVRAPQNEPATVINKETSKPYFQMQKDIGNIFYFLSFSSDMSLNLT